MQMKWILTLLIALAFIGTASLTARAEDKEKKEEHEKQVDIANIPAAAKAAIEKEVGESTVTKVLEGSDTEGGKATYYEAKYTKDGKKLEVKVDPEGKVISKGNDDD